MSERRLREIFATVASVRLDLAANRATVRLAGHPPPLLLAGGRVAPVPAPQRAAARRAPRAHRRAYELEFDSEDWSLLLYTDGLIEGRVGAGDERLDVPGLGGLVAEPARPRRAAGRPARPGWSAGPRTRNGGPLADDVAMLLVSRGGGR